MGERLGLIRQVEKIGLRREARGDEETEMEQIERLGQKSPCPLQHQSIGRNTRLLNFTIFFKFLSENICEIQCKMYALSPPTSGPHQR